MKKYKITIPNDNDAYVYVDNVGAAMVMVGEILNAGNKKITIETFDHPEKDKNADSK